MTGGECAGVWQLQRRLDALPSAGFTALPWRAGQTMKCEFYKRANALCAP